MGCEWFVWWTLKAFFSSTAVRVDEEALISLLHVTCADSVTYRLLAYDNPISSHVFAGGADASHRERRSAGAGAYRATVDVVEQC